MSVTDTYRALLCHLVCPTNFLFQSASAGRTRVPWTAILYCQYWMIVGKWLLICRLILLQSYFHVWYVCILGCAGHCVTNTCAPQDQMIRQILFLCCLMCLSVHLPIFNLAFDFQSVKVTGLIYFWYAYSLGQTILVVLIPLFPCLCVLEMCSRVSEAS